MNAEAHEELERHYAGIESRYAAVRSTDYATLVTANGNSVTPVHRWFRMKEAYSNRLLERVIKDVEMDAQESITLLDPFSGSGTTGASAAQLVREGLLQSAAVTAVEVNPFLHLLSHAKMVAPEYHPSRIQAVAGAVARRAISRADGVATVPDLSTFSNQDYFPRNNLEDLLALRASLDASNFAEADAQTREFLQVALAAAIEPSSNLRRDGRALRLTPGKACTSPIDAFLSVAEMISQDAGGSPINFRSTVIRGDSRALEKVEKGTFDLSVFSPPYPNNIDYTEVYKMEAWLLGLYTSSEEFSQQRKRTLRSHSSLRWGSDYTFDARADSESIRALVDPVVSAIPSGRYEYGRREVVLGYIDDMLLCIGHVHAALRPGGAMVIVVGNSMHGKSGEDYVIASDLLLSRLAEIVGFTVEHIDIARYPRRRTARSQYLRESVVFCRKGAS